MQELKELKEKLCKELKGYGKKELSAGSLDVIDKLSHTVKNLDKIIEKEDYSGDSSSRRSYAERAYDGSAYDSYADRSYNHAYDMNTNTSSRRRDSMGRYARDDEMIHKMYELMDETDDPSVRMDIQKLISKIHG